MAEVKIIAAAAVLLLQSAASHAEGDAQRGQQLYQQLCAACHSPDYNGVGPAHRGVFGARAGTARGYSYSTALAASKLRWDAQNLDRWLAGPEALVPGQKMGVSVPGAQDRVDLIAYLATLSVPANATNALRPRE